LGALASSGERVPKLSFFRETVKPLIFALLASVDELWSAFCADATVGTPPIKTTSANTTSKSDNESLATAISRVNLKKRIVND
jgi:hypothetical protein